MTHKTAIIWFRQDLRLNDNPALNYAVNNGYAIIPLYILDDENADQWKMGGASRWWLHQSLQSLNADLREHMIFRVGKADAVLPQLIEEAGTNAVFWNRCYEPWRVKRDKELKQNLKDNDVDVETFNASLLWEPWEVAKDDGTPYRVFTPYYRKGCLKVKEPREPVKRPERISYAEHKVDKGMLEDLKLMPEIKWYTQMEDFWQPGEDGAHKRLQTFLEDGFKGYKEDRNRPDRENVSRISPHLHFGEISPHQVWHTARGYGQANAIPDTDIDHYCSELGWREFSYYLLYHFPHITWENFQPKFNEFPWNAQESADLTRWQKGQTGIPIVDAGMRQLWQTGWMHNRVRMIVGSLLVKNLLIHWHRGEEWFWDCLVDADLASNSASWQWVAGSGADAAPYFRIFNPLTQGEKFDPDGDYVREFVPELKDMPNKYIHKPWETPEEILHEAGVILGENYPKPIVDLKASRERALKAFETTKKAS
ncbi:MAG: deoxyribodipyrimidine photo-lyase [Alphaproteobacteria bacterium]|nr:deoxyribodipyrimidine photo-lyase [Alphaproteobacteria bacterium]